MWIQSSIYGGTINATGGSYGSGIGSGAGGCNGSILIDGGVVTATGNYDLSWYRRRQQSDRQNHYHQRHIYQCNCHRRATMRLQSAEVMTEAEVSLT